MNKVLFVYPNKEGYPVIPIGISILARILKNSGHMGDLFDITFMISERIDNNERVNIRNMPHLSKEKIRELYYNFIPLATGDEQNA